MPFIIDIDAGEILQSEERTCGFMTGTGREKSPGYGPFPGTKLHWQAKSQWPFDSFFSSASIRFCCSLIASISTGMTPM